MRHVKIISAVACATLLLAAAADAQTPTLRRTTYLTFSTPVELPGVTLPAGTYTFQLAESTSDRHIVQVLDRDGQKLHTTILAVPVRRVNTTEETVVTFHELPAEATPAVRFWYYPGDIMGQELAYPKDQALRLAAASRQPVLAIASEGELASAQITRVEPDAVAVDTQTTETRERVDLQADARAQADTRAETDMQATGTTGRDTDTTARRERLPRTASQLPLVGLIGLLALGGAIATRAYRTART